ncbi:MAG: hypothetical protein JO352_27085 [Chloroflexi bacterium]|nr:hypothetical protein [Chloroflexota bacterium]MBV9602403.1 hypothetical protein [Chloroflexota bacterium]
MTWLDDGTAQGVLLSSGAVLVWALALYVASRAPARRAAMLAAVAMLCLAVYLMGEALGALSPDLTTWADWLRRTWWAPALGLPAWLAVTLALAADEGPEPWSSRVRRWFVPITAGTLAVGALFGGVGSLTRLVQDWSAPFQVVSASAVGVRHVAAGGWFVAFQAFALVCLVWAAANLAILWHASPARTPLRSRFGWLTASAAMFLLGGGWIVVVSGDYFLVGLPGQMLLVVGMLILGWNMARYGALLSGEQVLGDFVAFSVAMLTIVAVYGGVLLILAPDYGWIERGLPLLLLVMTTHVVVDTRGHVLDRLVYAPLLGTLRGQLRDLGNRVVRQPDEVSALTDVRETVDQILRERSPETDWRVMVEGALRHLNDLPALSQHPLLQELPWLSDGTPLTTGTPLERASALRNVLEQAIERLRPAGARPSPGTSVVGGWLHYLVLKEAYVDGRPNKQIMQRYAVSEGTFHRARRRAIDAVASDVASGRGADQAVHQ